MMPTAFPLDLCNGSSGRKRGAKFTIRHRASGLDLGLDSHPKKSNQTCMYGVCIMRSYSRTGEAQPGPQRGPRHALAPPAGPRASHQV